MITVKEAAKRAVQFYDDLLGEKVLPVSLEEVEKVTHNGHVYWYITLGMPAPGLQILTGQKEYKLFRVDGETGEVESMKIRVIDAA
jgi:hypothetical protein